jgi:hypothetical protein
VGKTGRASSSDRSKIIMPDRIVAVNRPTMATAAMPH